MTDLNCYSMTNFYFYLNFDYVYYKILIIHINKVINLKTNNEKILIEGDNNSNLF